MIIRLHYITMCLYNKPGRFETLCTYVCQRADCLRLAAAQNTCDFWVSSFQFVNPSLLWICISISQNDSFQNHLFYIPYRRSWTVHENTTFWKKNPLKTKKWSSKMGQKTFKLQLIMAYITYTVRTYFSIKYDWLWFWLASMHKIKCYSRAGMLQSLKIWGGK